jgi:hypothetical protein
MNEDYGINPDNKDYNKPTTQAISSQKVLELYNWWKNRDYRTDPDSMFSKEKDGKNYYKKINQVMDDYDKEDTNMLIELIKIRGSLWS